MLLCFLPLTLIAQKVTVSGEVVDRANGQKLIGAQVYTKGAHIGTATDIDGKFSLNVKPESTIIVGFIGYENQVFQIGTTDTLLHVRLQTNVIETEEVTVRASSLNSNVHTVQSGVYYLSAKTIKQLPTFMGEADPIRALTSAPGVTQTEGSQGFSVRGAGRDQNLILLNGAPVYNPSHLLGLFSVFNADAVREVTLMKSGISAQYGGRLSSVMLVKTGTGKPDSLQVVGSLGLLSSNVRIKTPIIKDKLWIGASARRTYISKIIKGIELLQDGGEPKTEMGYGFGDFDLNLEYKLNEKHHVDVSAYWGDDTFTFINNTNLLTNDVKWGNRVVSTSWRYIPNSDFSWENTLSYSNYIFSFDASQQFFEMDIVTDIKTVAWRSGFYKRLPKEESVLRWGADVKYHLMSPNDMELSIQDEPVDFPDAQTLHVSEPALYCNLDYPLSSSVLISGGVRFENFTHWGPFEYQNEQLDKSVDTVLYSSGEIVESYNSVQPRFSLRYLLSEHTSFKTSYNYMVQHIHLTSMSSSALPADIWFPSSKDVLPMKGHQVTVGVFHSWFDKTYQTSIELYAKKADNVGDTGEDFYQLYNSARLKNSALWGKSQARGVEFSLRKEIGNLTGSVSMTLSKSEMIVEEVNDGAIYNSVNDKPVEGSIFLNYTFNEKWSSSCYFVYSSGKVTTMPVQRYLIAGNLINYSTARNDYRLPDYHRLDVSVTRSFFHSKGNTSQLVFSVYNAYSRLNPYYVYFETTGDIEKLQLQMNTKAVSFFPILPSIAWRFSL